MRIESSDVSSIARYQAHGDIYGALLPMMQL